MRLLCAVTAWCVVGCTSVQVATSGRALLPAESTTYDQAVTAVLQAVTEAGFVVAAADRPTGYVSAWRATNPVLANSARLSMVAQVSTSDSGTVVTLQSVLPGQMVGYGATTDAVHAVADQMLLRYPAAIVTVDGQPYPPERRATARRGR